ncbi:MAG: hypothetical protein A3B91_01890 [Candidatus Yanofskybacteria bacterium RIFCSPHIGHO2_02_FULL_41_29]|uniref:DUF1573 domain-containing protein n=1 Tax=Candidatus Yanofskybacteria bacterium RIFCSPHIGHO2_01_FULL_41_53 TaxID=1802663 RepID=A0A1F8EJE6_9BACT|nr:MAG: hypothetical protein A2650_04330 [Candidatus Yanofskybacteria bacterium RIFCSPHIGHO2_01_FULL_41_53]OGN11212.1 MAG: hypothetical protein A3B91_01890 [Candidatus Yanofskybacteria bacterium RIFCSPHIGHO2_02_FULL_41_29]OGN22278.1 MAG: hypothetical protein A2916_04135 [Candidatus Yanofskybacteria bacterium RIFCSPLOWO2_01_FULL_41_67]OGN29646.1 MAG: hypothetical protein A3H54_00775 [Candidatus Yanofskybacteria bacterium RIFCSPLOWO2_02_FULL_41_13]OGN34517.1 MAG: hypothetical protein A3F98_02685 
MYKNPILIFIVFTAVIIVVAVIFRPAPAEQQSAVSSSSALSSDSTYYDFGSISMANGEVAYEFKVKNVTDQKVEIGKMYTSCMCTVAWFIKGEINKGPFGMPGHGYVPPVKESLNSGEEAVIKVVFDPNAHGPAGIGKIQRSIFIESDGSKSLELQISASVTP